MTPGARLAAAIEVLADIEARRRPAADALKDWGLAHRFAGSGDRAAIAGVAYDALRRKSSAAFVMDDATPRAVVFGMLALERKLDVDRDAAAQALSHLAPTPTRWSPWGLRLVLAPDAKNPAIHAEPAFIKGQIEVQDEGSQVAALCAGAKPGEQVVDLCAGAGGKTLALAAAMEGRGQVHATDSDKRRLAPIHARIARADVHSIQVHTPTGPGPALDGLAGRADLVLIDAPCTGTGAWRRNPDAKWRVRPGALEMRCRDQAAALDAAAPLVKPGGRIAYVTCSVLAEENGDQVRAFVARHPTFAPVPPADVANALGERAFLFRRAVLISDEGLLMTPRRTDTDGFYVAVLTRSA